MATEASDLFAPNMQGNQGNGAPPVHGLDPEQVPLVPPPQAPATPQQIPVDTQGNPVPQDVLQALAQRQAEAAQAMSAVQQQHQTDKTIAMADAMKEMRSNASMSDPRSPVAGLSPETAGKLSQLGVSPQELKATYNSTAPTDPYAQLNATIQGNITNKQLLMKQQGQDMITKGLQSGDMPLYRQGLVMSGAQAAVDAHDKTTADINEMTQKAAYEKSQSAGEQLKYQKEQTAAAGESYLQILSQPDLKSQQAAYEIYKPNLLPQHQNGFSLDNMHAGFTAALAAQQDQKTAELMAQRGAKVGAAISPPGAIGTTMQDIKSNAPSLSQIGLSSGTGTVTPPTTQVQPSQSPQQTAPGQQPQAPAPVQKVPVAVNPDMVQQIQQKITADQQAKQEAFLATQHDPDLGPANMNGHPISALTVQKYAQAKGLTKAEAIIKIQSLIKGK